MVFGGGAVAELNKETGLLEKRERRKSNFTCKSQCGLRKKLYFMIKVFFISQLKTVEIHSVRISIWNVSTFFGVNMMTTATIYAQSS